MARATPRPRGFADRMVDRYAYPGATLADAERIASGYAMVTDKSQPVDEATLSADIDAMRAALGIR